MNRKFKKMISFVLFAVMLLLTVKRVTTTAEAATTRYRVCEDVQNRSIQYTNNYTDIDKLVIYKTAELPFGGWVLCDETIAAYNFTCVGTGFTKNLLEFSASDRVSFDSGLARLRKSTGIGKKAKTQNTGYAGNIKTGKLSPGSYTFVLTGTTVTGTSFTVLRIDFFIDRMGCAWAYEDLSTRQDFTKNCYLYAIGEKSNIYGKDGLLEDVNEGYNFKKLDVESQLQKMITEVKEDVIKRGGTVRVLNGAHDDIDEKEYRVAMRVSGSTYTPGVPYASYMPLAPAQPGGGIEPDYHFWRQTDTGIWCEKSGWDGHSRTHDVVSPSVTHWDAYGLGQTSVLGNFYSSRTVYFAIYLPDKN